MALSNTAVPKYYGMFRDAVIRGEIPVNKEISMEMNRIDDLIANPGVYYDDKAVEGFILYCENELTLTDGSDLNLLDSFKVWSEQIFGWYYFVERSVYEPSEDGHGGHYVKKHIRKRLINKQYLIVARGAAKSMYGSCLQNYFLNVDITTTHQITTAPTMKQAEEVLSPIRTAITRSRGPYYKFLTDGSIMNTSGSKANRVKLASTKKGIENFLTGSLLEIRPMRIDKLQGLQLKVATVDEWLSGDIREDVIGAIEQGASKVDDYLIVAISSEGTVRNGAGDTIKMELQDILKGEYINPHVSIWWYKLDSVEEVSNPDMWLKANPNLGKTVSYETYQLDVERAEKAPAARNDILAKRFGLPMEGYTYYADDRVYLSSNRYSVTVIDSNPDIFTKISGDLKNAGKTATIMLGLSVSVLILASALKKIASLSWNEIAKGLTGITVISGVLAGVAKVISKDEKTIAKGAFNLIFLATAVKILASACKDISQLSWGELGKGLDRSITGLIVGSESISESTKSAMVESVSDIAPTAPFPISTVASDTFPA